MLMVGQNDVPRFPEETIVQINFFFFFFFFLGGGGVIYKVRENGNVIDMSGGVCNPSSNHQLH